MRTKTELAQNYVEKYIDLAHKNKRQYSKRFIATVAFEENPTRFSSMEDARDVVRRVTNSIGRLSTKYIDLAAQFALIPSAIEENRIDTPFIVPTSIKKTLFMADIHGRFYNRKAFEMAIEYGVKKGCDSVLIDGDFLDFYQHSKFDKNPAISIIMDEQEWGVDVLQLLQNTFGTVILKEGNHDARREAHVARLAATMPELMGMASYSDYLFFDGCHVDFVADYQRVEFGKLNVIHGHELYGSGGINVARNRFLKTLDNIVSAHSHMAQSIVLPDIKGHIKGSWTLGCLCKLNPRYSPINTWSNGFAVIEKDSTGEFEVDNRVIYGSKSVPI